MRKYYGYIYFFLANISFRLKVFGDCLNYNGSTANMNMIICNEKCLHQKEGYCALTGVAQITNALSSPCCYYEDMGKDKKGGSVNDKNTLT